MLRSPARTYREVILVQCLTIFMIILTVNAGTGKRAAIKDYANEDCHVLQDGTGFTCDTDFVAGGLSSYKNFMGTLDQLLDHCRTVKQGFPEMIPQYNNDGLGTCEPDLGERCVPYTSCMMTLATKDQVGPTHIDMGDSVYIHEPSIMTTYRGDEFIQNAVVHKTAMVRICPRDIKLTSHYMHAEHSGCTYLFENGDVPRVDYAPFTAYVLAKGLMQFDQLINGEWHRDFKYGGISLVEEKALRLIVLMLLSEDAPMREDIKELRSALNRFTENGTLINNINSRLYSLQYPECIGDYCDNRFVTWIYYGKGRLLVTTYMIVISAAVTVCLVLAVGGLWLKIVMPMRNKRAERNHDDITDYDG